MASALMVNDRLAINKINPTSWTGDFGINHDGFRKDLFMDGSYVSGIDETPGETTEELTTKPMDLAGNVYLKTVYPSPAPTQIYPARKFEYSDGVVSWVRPQQPWLWMQSTRTQKMFSRIITILFIFVIVYYIMSRMK